MISGQMCFRGWGGIGGIKIFVIIPLNLKKGGRGMGGGGGGVKIGKKKTSSIRSPHFFWGEGGIISVYLR